MGFSRLGLAIGGAIGYIGGGWLFDLGQIGAPARASVDDAGHYWHLHFLRWVGSLARNAPRRLLERDARFDIS